MARYQLWRSVPIASAFYLYMACAGGLSGSVATAPRAAVPLDVDIDRQSHAIDSLVIIARPWHVSYAYPMSHAASWFRSRQGVFKKLDAGLEYTVVRDTASLKRFADHLPLDAVDEAVMPLDARLSVLIFRVERVDTLSIGRMGSRFNQQWIAPDRIVSEVTRHLSPEFRAQTAAALRLGE